MVLNTSVAIAASYDDSLHFLGAVLLTILAFLLNVTFVKLNPTLNNIRNDRTDAWRWVLNFLLFDISITVLMTPTFETACFFWLTLIVGAFFDIYHSKLRFTVTGFGIICALTSLVIVSPDHNFLSHTVFLTTVGALLFCMRTVELKWIDETLLKFRSLKRETELQSQAEALFRSSLTGENASLIAHEVDNMITGINFAVDNPLEIALDKVNLSLGYVKQACDLLMKETSAKVEPITVGKLIEDVNLLLRKQIESKGIIWNIECESKLHDVVILERVGCCYFIIQNFIRNAIRAVASHKSQGKIRLAIEEVDHQISISIQDNGKGITPEVREKMLAGKGTEINMHHHGLGMKFVVLECFRNDFKLFVESLDDEFKTAVGFYVPKT